MSRRSVLASRAIELGSPAHLRLLAELTPANHQGILSLRGDTLIRHQGRKILIKNTH